MVRAFCSYCSGSARKPASPLCYAMVLSVAALQTPESVIAFEFLLRLLHAIPTTKRENPNSFCFFVITILESVRLRCARR
jgi:hypothetical protein